MRSRRMLASLLFAGLIAGAAPRAQAVAQATDCFDKPVATVKLQVNGHADYPQTLVSGLDVRQQSPFTRDAYRRSVERLVKLGSFEEVAVACNAGPGGVDVVFEAVPPHPLKALYFHGKTGLTPETLEAQITQRFNGTPNIAPDLVRQEVIRVLNDHGYMNPFVEYTRDTFDSPDRSTLSFQMDAGPLAQLGKVTINNKNWEPISRARVETSTGLVAGRPYRPGPIRDALTVIVRQLKSKGYYTAFVIGPTPTKSGDNTYDVTVDLDPGPLVTLEWDRTGDPPPSFDINSFVPIKQQNTIDQDLLDDSKARIETYLNNQGYPAANVEIHSDESATRRALKVRVTLGPKNRIDAIAFPPGLHFSRKELDTWLAVKQGDVLSGSKVASGLSRIATEYLKIGYYRVKIVTKLEDAANRPKTAKERWVVLRPEITEGPKGEIVDVTFERTTTQVPEADLRTVMQGVRGAPFLRVMDELDTVALQTLYLDLGYRTARVDITRQISADGTQITRVVHIQEGPQIFVADVQIVGWRDISEKAIREEMVLRAGQPFGEGARMQSQRRLYDMGVFRQVSVDAEPLRPGETGVHLIVRVVEAPDTTVAFGGGLEAGRKRRTTSSVLGYEDRIEVSPRVSFDVSRRNLGGRNRSISLFTRLSLSPRDVPDDPLRDGRGYAASEYRAAITYQERRAFGTDTDWLFGIASEQAIRPTFNFRRNGGNVSFQRLLSLRTRATARYTIDLTKLYDVRLEPGQDLLPIDRAFPQVRLSTFGIGVFTDHRDDAVSPTRGSFRAVEAEIAPRALGSQVGYSKTLLQASAYKGLAAFQTIDSRGRAQSRIVAAVRAEVGLARGFERPNPSPTPENPDPFIAEIPASQRFFAGGGTTVRGFQLDQLGAPGVLTPAGVSQGGNGMVVLNAELRIKTARIFGRQFSTAVFTDSGNVFAKVSDMSLTQLRGSVGFGVRYDSPLGPLRFDLGRKLSRMTFISPPPGSVPFREKAWEFHLSFGEIF